MSRKTANTGKQVVDYVAAYLENIRERRVFPDVKPGYMKSLVPEEAPFEAEKWETIFADVDRVIMPGIVHWQSPYMHAYFPALNSIPSLLGDMIADGINCLGFTWASSPACTELECAVMDWLAKMLNLPIAFLHSNKDTNGGGTILTTASEGTFVSILAARKRAINRCKEIHGLSHLNDSEINGRLVAYTSEQAHSSVEKAATMSLVTMRFLPVDGNYTMRGDTLRKFILEDLQKGLYPFYVAATLGTTGACAFDDLAEIGPICEEYKMWLHVDAAYAGTSFICPELREPLRGIEYCHSFVFNPSKWLMVHFDCTAFWVRDASDLHRTFNVQPLYLKHENAGTVVDFMHWQIPLSKRFRALKLWFVIRYFGVSGLQNHVREGVKLAEHFATLVDEDERFERIAKRNLGLVTFRLKGEDSLTEALLRRINSSGSLHMVPASLKEKYILRYVITAPSTKLEDVNRDWKIIQSHCQQVLDETISLSREVKLAEGNGNLISVQAKGSSGLVNVNTRRSSSCGMSLLLTNVQRATPFVNCSYVAMFENEEALGDLQQQVTGWVKTRPLSFSPQAQVISKMMRRRISSNSFSQSKIKDGNSVQQATVVKPMKMENVDSTGVTQHPNRRPHSKINRKDFQTKERFNSLDSKIDGIMSSLGLEEGNGEETH